MIQSSFFLFSFVFGDGELGVNFILHKITISYQMTIEQITTTRWHRWYHRHLLVLPNAALVLNAGDEFLVRAAGVRSPDQDFLFYKYISARSDHINFHYITVTDLTLAQIFKFRLPVFLRNLESIFNINHH